MGGSEDLVLPSTAERNFAVANDGIYFIEAASGKRSIQFLAFATGKVRTIAPIPTVGDGFSVSPDGRSFLFGQTDDSLIDLMLVENFRP